MSLHFEFPLVLCLLPAALLCARLPHGRGWDRVTLLRTVLFALLLTALAGPEFIRQRAADPQVLVLDEMSAASEADRTRLEAHAIAWKNSLANPEEAAVVLVASDPARPRSPLDGLRLIPIIGRESAAPLTTALENALRLLPAKGGGLTLLSAGRSTEADWGPAIQPLIERGVGVKIIESPPAVSAPRILALHRPELLRAGHRASLTVDLGGDARPAAIELREASGSVLASSGPLRPVDAAAPVRLDFTPENPGFLPLKVVVLEAGEGGTPRPAAELEWTAAIQEPVPVAYLGAAAQPGAPALQALLGPGFRVTALDPRSPEAARGLADCDLAVIDDLPASLLSPGFEEPLVRLVQEGRLGLLFSGGRNSYSDGGYAGTALSAILPVESEPQQEKQDPSTALVFIIDTSGSMQGPRIELAKQIARLTVRNLKAHDRVGIVEFYGNKHWALPLQSATNKLAIDRAIGRMQAAGGTVLAPAIEEALYGLKNISTRFKHIVLITDAGIEDADYESLIRRTREEGINFSTVLVGAQAHSTSLVDMANWGDGRFYAASDRYALPELLLKQPSSEKLPGYRAGPVNASPRGTLWWRDLESSAPPALAGYARAKLRDGAEAIAVTAEQGDPLAATWPVGAGVVTAITTEISSGGGAPWLSWNSYGNWLSRLAGETAGDASPFSYSIHRYNDEVLVSARALFPADDLHPDGGAAAPHGGETARLTFRRLTPDLYEARFPWPRQTPALVTTWASDGAGGRTGGVHSLTAEVGIDPATGSTLAAIFQLPLQDFARVTGGSLQTVDAPFGSRPESGRPTTPAITSLKPFLALLALLVFLVELLVRRRLPHGTKATLQ